jgi:hypothetical protein
MKWLPTNANKEVAQANQVMASWHIARMAKVSNAKSSKLDLLTQPSKSMAAYIVGTTSVNVTDSKLTADLLVASDNRKKSTRAMLINAFATAAITTITGSPGSIIPIAGVVMAGYAFDKQESCTLLIGILGRTTLLSKALLVLMLFAEETNVVSDAVKKRVYPYILLPTLIGQVITGFF